ncbi:hypothetical protein [Bacteroides sp.]
MKNSENISSKSAKTRNKITYVPYEGVIAEDGNGILAFFKLGANIKKELVFPYAFEDEYEDDEGYHFFPLYMFFDETFQILTERDNKPAKLIYCAHSFIFEGYELMGMEFEKLLQIELLQLDYVHNNYYGPGNNINFRYYTVYYNLEHKLSIYVWRRKIREILINEIFFQKKEYENPEYLDRYKIIKL